MKTTDERSVAKEEWLNVADYAPPEDSEICRRILEQGLRPRTVAYKVYQVIQYEKRPGLKGMVGVPNADEEAFSPGDAQEAFVQRIVPKRWVHRFAAIAAYEKDSAET